MMSSRPLYLSIIALLLLLVGCAQPPPDLGIKQIIVTPGSLLFTSQEQSQQLSAVALGADGQPIEVTFSWSSSRSETVSVDATGNAMAQSDLGSSQLIATAGGVSSAPVLAVVAQVNEGVVLVADTQIVSEPTPLTPDAVPEIGVQYRVTLKDVSTLAVGSLLMGTGDKPLAGKVISTAETSEGLEVVLELVSPDDLFVKVKISEALSLNNAETSLAPEVEQSYTVKPQGEEQIGPFKCDVTSANKLADILKFSTPPVAKLDTNLNLLLDWDSASGYKRFVLAGGAKVTFSFSPTVTASVTYSLECKQELLRKKIPVKGIWQIFLGGDVPIGLGFKLEGKGTAAKFGLDFSKELGADFKLGVECPVGSGCAWVKDLTPTNKGKFDIVLPDSDSQFRLEGTVFPFLWSKAELGVGFFKKAHLNLLEVKAGLEQASNLAPPNVQAKDATYASDYKLSLTGVISAGGDVEKVKKLFGDGLAKLEFKVGIPLGTSPKASILAADKTTFKKGDKVTFAITLDPATYKYPEIGYNIREVQLYRKGMNGEVTLLTSQQPSGEQRDFKLEWTADVDGSLGKDYFAFVVPVALPLALELGVVGEPIVPTCTTPPAGASYCVIEIGTLQNNLSQAFALNERGQVVGNGGGHAFLWQNGSLTDLTVNGTALAGGTDINENGQVVGYWSASATSVVFRAFSWQNGTFRDLGTFEGAEGIWLVVCVNNAGQIVTSTLNPSWAILVQSGGTTQLKDPANYSSKAGCINERGQVAGDGYVQPRPNEGYEKRALLWQSGGAVTDLGTLNPKYNIVVTDLNDSAAVVGYGSVANADEGGLPSHALLWQGGKMTDLGTLGAGNSSALAINNRGQIVGHAQNLSGVYLAALWEGTTITDLNTLIGTATGWSLDVANDINDKGYIVGTGRHNGALRGFLLVPTQP
jgi:probable HAF family extracellular repeat protein